MATPSVFSPFCLFPNRGWRAKSSFCNHAGPSASHFSGSFAAAHMTRACGLLFERQASRLTRSHDSLPNTLACLALWLGSVEIGVPLFFILFGLAIGMPHATNAALIAEVYGTRYMGEIKALFMPVGVFASALSPMLMGWMIDAGLGLDALLGMNIALAFGAQIMAMLVLHFRKAL